MAADIVTHLSHPRLATYLRRCHGDEDRALALYRANASIGGTAYIAIHYFEVIVRNALDRELQRWNQATNGTADWTMAPAPLLEAVLTRERLYAARRDAARAAQGRRAVTHDDVLVRFTLGAWRGLLPTLRNRWKQTLWEEALQHSFANRQGVRTDQIVQSVSIVYDLRNRIAHHEPIFALDLRGKRRAMRDVLNSISPTARRWFVEHEPLSPRWTTSTPTGPSSPEGTEPPAVAEATNGGSIRSVRYTRLRSTYCRMPPLR